MALYSHDTQGLGHIRRNLAIADALVAADAGTDVVVLTGNPEAATLPRPPRTDLVTLPTVRKDAGGGYDSRALGIGFDEVLRLRSAVLEATLTTFAPDLLVVDKVALGLGGELEPVLRRLRETGGTRVVLGLREVLDAPDVAVREWEVSRTSQAVRRYYDAVWVYGDQAVYDTVAEYRLPGDVARMVDFTGYLARGRDAGASARGVVEAPPSDPYVLCLCGGGQDGVDLARAFAAAPLPDGVRGLVVTGPFMPTAVREELHAIAARSPRVEVRELVANVPALVAGARAVVSMAGYNSVCELLDAGARTLLVPRTAPRLEQMVRARRLAELGHADVLHPREATPQRLGRWLEAAVTGAHPGATTATPHPVDLDGLDRVPILADRLLEGATRAA
ncbi:glycosyl transferase family 28 [Xylanimonas oleitrophica]|uniref:Glycosyl transferase family 28 n=1 Tax=Xylanimonas oleitrophica TaxID=2607479 RepID=A0A2W5YE60_9MICO|nr:glycosyl transferase family 28 [Xylanimonas oleitrophica]